MWPPVASGCTATLARRWRPTPWRCNRRSPTTRTAGDDSSILGLVSTGWFLADFPDPEVVARPHQVTEDGWRIREHYGYPTYPNGQLRATASDLGRLLRLTINDGEIDGIRVLQPGVREALSKSVPVSGIADWFLQEYFTSQHLFWFSTTLGSRHRRGTQRW